MNGSALVGKVSVTVPSSGTTTMVPPIAWSKAASARTASDAPGSRVAVAPGGRVNVTGYGRRLCTRSLMFGPSVSAHAATPSGGDALTAHACDGAEQPAPAVDAV